MKMKVKKLIIINLNLNYNKKGIFCFFPFELLNIFANFLSIKVK
jgi:hypothetical protein